MDSSSYIDDPGHHSRPGYSPPAIGSIQIDEAFQREVKKRLELIRGKDGVPHILRYAAGEMTRGEFQHIKSSFGAPKVSRVRQYKLAVPGLPSEFSNLDAKIEDGRMIFTR